MSAPIRLPSASFLAPARSLAGRNLRGRDLHGLDWSHRNLEGADLSGADLRDTLLVGANLRGANLFSADLAGADLRGACLDDADLSQANGTDASFGNASLVNCCARGAHFENATFSHATLDGANLQTAEFDRARMLKVSMRDVDGHGADFSRTDLSEAVVDRANFDAANFSRARMRHVREFSKSSWYGCEFTETDFSNASEFKRFALDENYIRELRERNRLSAFGVWLWWVTSDCGRSFSRWGLWTVLIAILYGGAYGFVDVDFGSNETFLSPLYFSVVTITSLGYGDVLPTSPAAQLLAMSESTLGFCLLGGLITIFSNKIARRAD